MSEPTPKEPRGPTNLRIKFRSASLDQFIERYAVDVSRGGIFIRTREPLPVDTRLRLEFQLQDSTPLLAGEGTVVWIREHDPARENVTPGMGVRFDKLTPESQPTLEKILAEKTRLEQAGVAAVAQPKGGGMAVRRPSGVFASLDANARAVLGAGLPGASTEARRHRSRVDADLRAPSPARRPRRSPRPASWRRARGRPSRPRPRRSPARSPAPGTPAGGRSRFRRRCSRRPPRPTSTRRSRSCRRRPDRRRPRIQSRRLPATSPTTPPTSRRASRTSSTSWSAAAPARAGRSPERAAPLGRRARRSGRDRGGSCTVGDDARRASRDRGRRRGAGGPRGAGRGGGAGGAGTEQAVPRRLARLPHAEPPTERPHQLPRRAGRPRGGGRRGGEAAPQGSLFPPARPRRPPRRAGSQAPAATAPRRGPLGARHARRVRAALPPSPRRRRSKPRPKKKRRPKRQRPKRPTRR